MVDSRIGTGERPRKIGMAHVSNNNKLENNIFKKNVTVAK